MVAILDDENFECSVFTGPIDCFSITDDFLLYMSPPALVDRASVLLLQHAQRIREFYTSIDMGMAIAASVVSICTLMSLAILAQGSTDTVFLTGIKLWGSSSSRAKEKEKEEEKRDEAEEEVFGDAATKAHRGACPADLGMQAFMHSSIPKLTLLMLMITIVLGAYHAAVTEEKCCDKHH